MRRPGQTVTRHERRSCLVPGVCAGEPTIPTAKLEQKREFYGYDVAVTADELNQAEPGSETEGVKMLEAGRMGNTVLRVTVAEK